jgi:aryl-alcohol dehydrogenase-like predicted oxidoreductase
VQTLTLGQGGPSVAPLCVGTWAWGDTLFWNYGNGYGSAELREAFEASIAAGVTFFDTAEIYGMGVSEELLGEFVQQSGQSIAIATKYGPMLWRTGAQSVADALTASLKRLNVDRVALYQVHWPFTFLMSQQTLMNALADEVQRGRIEAVGVSNYSAAQMREAHRLLAARGIRLATNQVRYSLLARQVEHQGITAAAQELGVTILAYSPLAQGLLTGKYTVDSYKQPTGARRIDPQFNRRGLEKIAPVLAVLRELGDRYDRTPAQVALNWLIAQGNVIPIPGAKTAEQAKQNAGALGWQLQSDEVARLSRVTEQLT